MPDEQSRPGCLLLRPNLFRVYRPASDRLAGRHWRVPMTHASSEELFRQAAEAENGTPVSAGARVAHLRSALGSGRAFFVDLSGVPEDQRPALVAAITELVQRASPGTPRENLTCTTDSAKAAPD